MKRFVYVASFLTATTLCASTGYVVGSTNMVDSFDPSDTSIPAVSLTTAIGTPSSVAVSPNGQTVYVASGADRGGGDIYFFPASGPYTPTAMQVKPGGIGIDGLALSTDGSTGYFISNDVGTSGIYSFPTGGAIPHTATQLSASGTTVPSPIAIAISANTAYVSSLLTGNLYSFPITGGSSYNASVVQSGVYPSAIAISSDGYLYFVRFGGSGAVFRVPANSPTDTPQQVASVPNLDVLSGLAVSSDGNTVFIAQDGYGVYSFPTNSTFPQTPVFLSGLGISDALGLAIWSASSSSLLQIPLAGLTGNNRIFASYLNQNAPQSTIGLFTNLPVSEIASALKKAAPTRNAFSVFASDNALFSATQALSDHLQQRRVRRVTVNAPQNMAQLVVQTKDEPIPHDACEWSSETWGEDGHYGVWVQTLGDFAKQKAQNQTPAFESLTGGVIAAFDYHRCSRGGVGTGLAYLYTHLHENSGLGKANIQQGLATVYGEYIFSRAYIDFGVWFGYYHTSQSRHIAFTGYDATARSTPHGWQLLPHLEIGGPIRFTHLEIEPFVLFDWASNWQSKFTEQGALAFNVSQNSHYSSMLRSEGGLRFYEKVLYSWGTLTFLEKASYVNKLPFQTGSVTAFLAGSSNSFTVETLTGSQNLGVGTFEMIFTPSDQAIPKFALTYQGEFGSAFQSHQLNFCVEKTF